MGALLQQPGVSVGDRRKFLLRKVVVGEHPSVAVHVDVRDFTDQQNALLCLAGVFDQVADAFELVVVLLALPVNAGGLLEVLKHRGRRRGGLDHFVGRVDDALYQIGRIEYGPLGARLRAAQQNEKAEEHAFGSLFHGYPFCRLNVPYPSICIRSSSRSSSRALSRKSSK